MSLLARLLVALGNAMDKYQFTHEQRCRHPYTSTRRLQLTDSGSQPLRQPDGSMLNPKSKSKKTALQDTLPPLQLRFTIPQDGTHRPVTEEHSEHAHGLHHRKGCCSVHCSLNDEGNQNKRAGQDLRQKLHHKIPGIRLAMIIPDPVSFIRPHIAEHNSIFNPIKGVKDI